VKILVIGDAHIKINNLAMGRRFLQWIDEVVEVYQPELIVNLGDFFDSHSVLRAEILTEYSDHVRRICASKTVNRRYVHVLGNHEGYKPDSSAYHALQALKELDANYFVADTDTAVDIYEDISFIPYHFHPETFPTNTKAICFAHQTFVGADFGKFRPDIGVEIDKLSADIIISGHVHKGQTIGKVIYPGSAFAQGVDDVDQIKSICIFDSETYDIKRIPTPLPRWRSYTASLTDDAGMLNLDNIHQDLISTLTKDDKWIINLEGPRAELSAYLDSKLYQEINREYNLRVRVKYTDIVKDRVQIKAVTAPEAICQYIDKIYDGDLDKEMLKQKAIEILGKSVISL